MVLHRKMDEVKTP